MTTPLLSRFRRFLDDSPTSVHAVQSLVSLLSEQGFSEVDLSASPTELPTGFRGYVRRVGTVIAFVVGEAAITENGFRILAAHTDSPNLKIKPSPVVKGHGWKRLGVEVYGGVMVPTWADRDLGIAGFLTVKDGDTTRPVLVNVDQPVCRIPTLAIHLNRTVNDEGLKLNKQTHLPAIFTLDDDNADGFTEYIADQAGVAADDVLAWDLALYDLTKAAIGGAKGEFLFSARLDNLASCHMGIEALTASLNAPAKHTSILACFDHEEVGSRTSRGANGRMLESVLQHLLEHGAAQAPGGFTRALEHSVLISADMAHAVHPAYADKHDATHMPKLNAGPVIKSHANQNYTTEGDTAALFKLLCAKVDAPVQLFVNRSDLRCGSTVGPMLASGLGCRSVDVGNPMLSMHSVREMCGTADHKHMVAAVGAFFSA